MPNYLVRAPAIRAMSDGDMLHAKDNVKIVVTQPGNDWAVVRADSPEAIQALLDTGVLAEARPESVVRPLGIVTPTERNTMGDDFPVIGVTAEWQRAVDWGAGVIIGIADTGVPPAAAGDAHFPAVEVTNVYGGVDTQGHATFCVSRMVGPNGVLPDCHNVLVAQALPNGQGSTTTVVQAIRALWQHNPRPHVISLSLGMDSRDPVIDGEIRAAQNAGVPCSAAMGNSGAISQAGSPVAVCRYGWGATNLAGTTMAAFSSGLGKLAQETAAIPGENVGGAHLDGGYGIGSGTSFSCPVGSAIVGAARKVGWDA